MRNTKVLFAIVFGAMLAITGCGDDEDGTGDGGNAGMSGGGPSNSSCEAICSSTCVFEGVDPGDVDYDTCVSQCQTSVPQLDDDCGPQLDALLDCLEANDCDEETDQCDSQGIAWGTCITGIGFP